MSQKVVKYLGYFWTKILSSRLFKKSPIWSHCSGASQKLNLCETSTFVVSKLSSTNDVISFDAVRLAAENLIIKATYNF